MRKRLVIGAMAAVVIGLAAYFLSQPRKGSTEWHRREYVRAVEHLHGRRLVDQVVERYHRLKKTPAAYRKRRLSDADEDQLIKRMLASWDALREAGYLRKGTFHLEHQPKSRVAMLVERAAKREVINGIWEVAVAAGPENAVVVFAPADDLGKFEQLAAIYDIEP